MSEPVIVTQQLSRYFGATLAVDKVTLTIAAGEVFGFLGHNGAGKTTTVRLLNGVLTPTSGTVRVLGLDPTTSGPQVRLRTGVLTETPALDDRLTARESLRFYANLYSVPLDQVTARVEQLLEQFDLTARGDDKIGSFSKGMRQRMALARTLIHNPEIIFLDEPSAGLDPVASRDLHQLITYLSQVQKRTIFLCTHNLVEAQRLCQRVAVLAQGRLLALGTPAELAHNLQESQRVQVTVAPAQVAAASAMLSAWPGVKQVETAAGTPGGLQVQGLARFDLPQVIAALVQANFAIYSVIPAEPSLEDIYLALQASNQPGEKRK
jgi:ABC-2 type transport system ATP-binding protein